MSSTSSPVSRRVVRTLPVPAASVAAVLSASVVSIAVCAAVAAFAHSAGASQAFKALDVGTFSFFIVVGLLAATVAWVLIRRRSADPARLLGWLAPSVVVLSLVPDVLVGVTQALPGTSWVGVVALMSMHLVVAAVGVACLQLFLPLKHATGRDITAA